MLPSFFTDSNKDKPAALTECLKSEGIRAYMDFDGTVAIGMGGEEGFRSLRKLADHSAIFEGSHSYRSNRIFKKSFEEAVAEIADRFADVKIWLKSSQSAKLIMRVQDKGQNQISMCWLFLMSKNILSLVTEKIHYLNPPKPVKGLRN